MNTKTKPNVKPAPAPATAAAPLSEWMAADEAAAELRRPAREAKKLLKRHGVPIVEHSERDWHVRRSRVVGLFDELERQAEEAIKNADAQRDWLSPEKRGAGK